MAFSKLFNLNLASIRIDMDRVTFREDRRQRFRIEWPFLAIWKLHPDNVAKNDLDNAFFSAVLFHVRVPVSMACSKLFNLASIRIDMDRVTFQELTLSPLLGQVSLQEAQRAQREQGRLLE